jgi:hypothetical protein
VGVAQLLRCARSVPNELYRLSTGQTIRVQCNCSNYDGGFMQAGRYWLYFDQALPVGCGDAPSSQEACIDSPVYSSTVNGRIGRWPATATKVPDLNSPSLTRKLCAPVPPLSHGEFGPPNPVIFDGKFVLESQTSDSNWQLDQCASKRAGITIRVPNDLGPTQPFTTSHSIIWNSGSGRATEILLPSLRRITLRFPKSMVITAVSDEYGYLSSLTTTDDPTVWRAKIDGSL